MTGTFENEDSLPRVPIPTAKDSCELFLQWCRPLLDDDEFADTERSVDEFLAPDSPVWTLQDELIKYDRRPDVHSWLDEFWRDRYLGRRDSIAINANFFFLFHNQPEGPMDQLDRATGLVVGALAHLRSVSTGRFAPVQRRGVPFSMEGHKYLFGTTRIPGVDRDTVRSPYSDEAPGPPTSRHILVLHRGAITRLDVIGPDGRAHSPAEIRAALEAISAGSSSGEGVGRFTTMPRADWARTRDDLRKLGSNADALDTVETALFCLCLEDAEPADLQEACAELLGGDASNRWFDKAVSLIVFGDGSAGINGEHCMLDGTPVIEFLDVILATPAAELAAMAEAVEQGPVHAEPVSFDLDDGLRRRLAEAGAAFRERAENTVSMLVDIPQFGSDRAKGLGVSPDAFVQLAFQLAHRRSKGFTGASYESISTRTFHHGRTEAMRVVTPEVVRFVDAMTGGAPAAERLTALPDAAAAHVARAKQCQAGDAPEQHLWELQLLQRRLGGGREPSLYSSPGWQRMRHDYLSTSAVPSVHIQAFGFGATSSDCIGVAYWMLPEKFTVYLCTPREVGAQLPRFAEQLAAAVAEMSALASTKGEPR